MQTLGIVGPGATDLTERLAAQLDGRVATVERLPAADADTEAGVDAAFGLCPDGTWLGTGEDRSLSALVDDLAATYDYALLAGFPKANVPTLVVDDGDVASNADVVGEVLDRVDATVGPDLRKLTARIDELEPHVTLQTLINRVESSPRAERAGAVATFTGRVRAKESDDDAPTTHLEFEKYDGVAEERMAAISAELTARDGVEEVVMHHRTGVIHDGEDIVFVVVLAGHREEAFRAVEDGINRLKDEVPIFKKETTVDEEFWVHDRDE